MEVFKKPYRITDDKEVIDLDYVVNALQTTYWARDRKKEDILISIQNSIFLSLLKGDKQIGFARIVTDKVYFAWICDVFIDEKNRGEGLGKWLVQTIIHYPDIKDIKLQLLLTRDADELYKKFGFIDYNCLIKLKKD